MKKQLINLSVMLLAAVAYGQTITNYTTADGLLNDNVNCVDVDASDNVWFGTQGGVSMFNGTTWTSYTMSTDPELPDNNITAVFAASSGDVWIGTDFGASVLSGGNWTTYTTADGLGNDQIKCIGEDGDGDIWFGTNSGATEFTGSVWTSYGTAQGLPFGGVTAITLQSDGTLWMGSGLGGILKFDGTGFTGITSADGLIDDRIRSIVLDQQDNRWFGTSEGISVFNTSDALVTNHTSMFTLPAPDTLNPIEDMDVDSQGNIWVGVYVDYLVTQGGVCAYNGYTWVEYHEIDGLVGPVVRALAVDGNDNVWVATSTGISKIYDPALGVSANEPLAGMNVYPNPNGGDFYIAAGTALVGEINVFNTSMQEVTSEIQYLSDTQARIQLPDAAPGVYFCRVGNSVQKLILR